MSDTINYDIIVIGAGCGGLSAALCAAKEGKRVLVLERNNVPGGLSSSFIRGRFEFEAYPQDIPGFSPDDSGETKKLFDYMGVTDKIQWLKVPEAYRVISKFSDGTKLDATMPFGIENYIEAMEKYVPGSKAPLTKLFKIAEEIEASADRFTTDNLDSSVSFLKFLKNNGCFVKTAPYSLNAVLSAIKLPTKAQDIFKAYWLLFGVDCNKLSFTHYILNVFSRLKHGTVIPKHRNHELSMALAGLFEDMGGEIRYNSAVARIKFKNNVPSEVILRNGTRIKANHIICSCSPTSVYGKMIKADSIPASALKRTNARKLGAKGACVYLGLNRSPDELGINEYSYYITDTTNTEKQFELMKSIDTNNAQIAICLNKANPDASPKGTTILCIKTFYTENCWADVSPEEYFNQKDLLAARLIANFENTTGITIHNAIEELEVATPVTFARYTATPQGTVLGYYADDWDSLIPRLMTEATDNDCKGLRFCGSWGTLLSGIGAEIASGRNTAFATLTDIEENSKEVSVNEK